MTKFARHISIIIIAFASMPLCARAQISGISMTPLDWRPAAPAFDPDATPSTTPILLYFTAEWCGFCKQMDRTTLSDQTVRLRLAPLIHVKLDFDQQESLVKRYKIEGIPAFVLVNERGDEISRMSGATDTITFLKWLDSGEKQASDVAVAAQKLNLELHRLAEQAASNDPAVQATVRQRSFDMLGRGEPQGRKFAADFLGHLAQTNPDALLDGLANPDLAVRIAVANILRSRLGDPADFDPWATAADRQTSIDQLHKKLQH